jgi:uncharacterized membrane protein YphA (DoxX/SURF4 family)
VNGLLRSRPLQLVLRLLLGSYFVYASLDKIADPTAFARIVYQWQVAGPVPSNLVAATLPWVEILAGGLLILGVWKRESAAVIALLLAVFLAAASSVLARGIDVENCGCTSLAKTETADSWPPPWARGVGWFLVTRNVLLLGAALLLVTTAPRPAGAARESAGGASTAA